MLSTFPNAEGFIVGLVVGTSISGGSIIVITPSFAIRIVVAIVSTAFAAPAVSGARVNIGAAGSPSIISRSLDPHTVHIKSSITTITNMLKYGLDALNTPFKFGCIVFILYIIFIYN
jgi:hypothetical protein